MNYESGTSLRDSQEEDDEAHAKPDVRRGYKASRKSTQTGPDVAAAKVGVRLLRAGTVNSWNPSLPSYGRDAKHLNTPCWPTLWRNIHVDLKSMSGNNVRGQRTKNEKVLRHQRRIGELKM
jgi:hypothetical protein